MTQIYFWQKPWISSLSPSLWHVSFLPHQWRQMRARISWAGWIIIALFHQKPNELWNYLVGFLAKRCLRWCMTPPPVTLCMSQHRPKKWVFVRCPKRAWIIAHGWVWPFGGQHGGTHYRGRSTLCLVRVLEKVHFIATKNCSLSSRVTSTSFLDATYKDMM